MIKRGITYEIFYEVLMNLREEFHKNGRLDDSNAKLDEIVKLLIMSYYESKTGTNRFDLGKLSEIAEARYGFRENIAPVLRDLFEEISKDEMFYNNDGTNIFGPNPTLNIQPSENDFAKNLVKEISKIDFSYLINEGESSDFDLINECFGHFVRDNFRNNKEDAQYMTPQEVVFPVLDMVFSDLYNDKDFRELLVEKEGNFLIMDPTCGVGTLLIEPLRYIIKYVEKLDLPPHKKESIINNLKNNCVIGQDKVDRMVRLSKINMLLMGANISNIFHGNSILNGSYLDNFLGKVDLIVTNPPFGAIYNIAEIKNSKRYTIINNLSEDYTNIDSELIMLDRCVTLLKPKGKLVIVLPDSVVSAKGIYAKFREELLKICDIKAIIDLPAVTFAQAGTRTKTVIIYLEKKKTIGNTIFMSICNDIGYDVKERKGVPVKIEKGQNQMYMISKIYINSIKKLNKSNYEILCEEPSCTLVNESNLIDNFLTPNFYKSNRLKTLAILESIDKSIFDIVELGAITESPKRKRHHVSENIKHISILHINPDGTIDLNAVNDFKPVSKGTECYKGDVLFSKINPRIPRIAVVPDFDKQLVCSNEFEILVPKHGLNPYLLYILLNMEIVQNQIESLTAGTSSSHNRIKSDQLRSILIPIPKKGSKIYDEFIKIGLEVEEAIRLKYTATRNLDEQKAHLKSLIDV